MTVFNIKPYLLRNSGLGLYALSEQELSLISNGNTTSSGISVDSTTVGIEVFLENRYVISEIRYWFSGSGQIEFESSQNGDVWDPLNFSSGPGYAVVSGSLAGFDNYPKYVRIFHDASSSTDEVFEVEVKNTSKEIGFWQTGNLQEVDIDANVDSQVTGVEIFNKSNISKDFFCFINTQESDASVDNISLSSTEAGPFSNLYASGIKIPRDIPWASGFLSGTTESGSTIKLVSTSGTGYYHSPVFDLSLLNPLRVYFNGSIFNGSAINYSGATEGQATLAVKTSINSPEFPWVSGQYPLDTDSYWGSISGTLSFREVSNDAILEANVGQYKYGQISLRMNTTVTGSHSYITELGFEEATKIPSIQPNNTKKVYVKTTVSSYAVGNYVDLLTFFLE